MSDEKTILLETKIKHLTNEWRLAREEYETSVRNYFDIHFNLEKKVHERTKELNSLKEILEVKNLELQIMLDSSPSMIFYKDAKGRYLRVNRSFSENFGIPMSQIDGRTNEEIFSKEIIEALGNDESVYKTGEPIRQRAARVALIKGIRELIIDIVPYKNNAGKVVGIIGFIIDITQLRKAEYEREMLQERVMRVEKMEAIGRLAAGVAHDGNNLLAGLIGHLELMLMDRMEDTLVVESTKGALDAAHRLENMINDLLTITRSSVEAKRSLNMNALITNFMSSSRFLTLIRENTKIRFQTRLEPELLPIYGANYSLNKTFLNILSHTASFMPQGGKIEIVTRNTFVSKPRKGYDLSIKEGDYIVVEIIDNGNGISLEDQNRIFEPFYTKRVMGLEGTGLEMSVVYGTIQDHQGFVQLDSKLGQGSTFRLYFPVDRRDDVFQQKQDKLEDLMGHGERILVVDDLASQRQVLADMLTQLNYHVSIASSGHEAIEFMKRKQVHLVVLDMVMDPEMDGLDTYRNILRIRPKQPALVASGYASNDRIAEMIKLGAAAYIQKPYTFEKLANAVKEALI